MKKILFSLSLLLGAMYAFGQQQCPDCYENKGISTNPANPVNCEATAVFPGSNNPFLNTFNWAARQTDPNAGTSFNSIALNFHAGWQIPDYTSKMTAYMHSPYTHGYLDMSGFPLSDYDFAWEDGWELMYMNTGFFPNGDSCHLPSAISQTPTLLANTRVPYIVLYNRYTGKLRTFFNVFSDLGQFDDIKLNLGYLNVNNSPNLVTSGIFRHASGYDRPLDQPTATPAFSTNFTNTNNTQEWFMADAQLGYDPCVCNYFSKFDFQLRGINSTAVNLYGRSLSTPVPLQDANGKPTYNNWLNLNTTDQSLNATGSGALIYKTLDGMLDSYDDNLEKYQTQLNDYNSPGNIALRGLMAAGKTGLNIGLQGLVPATVMQGLITNAVAVIATPDDATFVTTDQATSITGSGKEYSTLLSKVLKGGVGALSDAVFTSFYTAPTKPVKPTMPTATLTEMRINGTIDDQTNVSIANLATPGAFQFGTTYTPQSYPIYNEPTGLFAMLETPEISGFKQNSVIKQYVSTIGLNIDKIELNLIFKLKSPLYYRYNHSIDFDFNRSKLYGQFEIEYYGAKDANGILTVNDLKMLHSLPDATGKTTDVFASDWYPLSMLGERYFNIYYTDPVNSINSNRYDIKKIKLKVMADMYFLSPGSEGREKNTTQVFTYLLYDADNNIDHIATNGEWLTSPASIVKYTAGKVTIDNEVIQPTDAFVFETIGNTMYINADAIELKGNVTVTPGYQVIMQAYWEITADPATEIGPGIEMRIKRDFYNFPLPAEVTNAELAAFCTGSSKKYLANITANKSGGGDPTQPVPAERPALTAQPNPFSETLTLRFGPETGTLTVYDVLGRAISSNTVATDQQQLDLSTAEWQPGVYIAVYETAAGRQAVRVVRQ